MSNKSGHSIRWHKPGAQKFLFLVTTRSRRRLAKVAKKVAMDETGQGAVPDMRAVLEAYKAAKAAGKVKR